MYGLVIDDPKFNFSASHFIADHDKCERLHGHNYKIKIELVGDINKNFMVRDFKEAKDLVNHQCSKLDHRLLLPEDSPSLVIDQKASQIEVKSGDKIYSFPAEDCRLLPIKASTAEELARYIFTELKKDLPNLTRAWISESEGSAAFYSEE
jgi:6-pyruvoyltetrahydropterin/6-carboxytetrahydropterin synthase